MKCTKNSNFFENIGPNWSKLGSFEDKHYILHVVFISFWIEWGKGYVTVIFLFLPMPLVSSVKNQSKNYYHKLPKSLLVGGQRLGRVI